MLVGNPVFAGSVIVPLSSLGTRLSGAGMPRRPICPTQGTARAAPGSNSTDSGTAGNSPICPVAGAMPHAGHEIVACKRRLGKIGAAVRSRVQERSRLDPVLVGRVDLHAERAGVGRLAFAYRLSVLPVNGSVVDTLRTETGFPDRGGPGGCARCGRTARTGSSCRCRCLRRSNA